MSIKKSTKPLPHEEMIDETLGEGVAPLSSNTDQLQLQLDQALAQAKRAQADYANVVRRSQEDRVKWSKLACQELITALLDPYHHLQLAAAQLNDHGLTMVTQQFEQVMAEFGLQPIAQKDDAYNPLTMEAIDGSEEDGHHVASVQQQGYSLNGEVIRPAKVVVRK